jgi:hypothetical protein
MTILNSTNARIHFKFKGRLSGNGRKVKATYAVWSSLTWTKTSATPFENALPISERMLRIDAAMRRTGSWLKRRLGKDDLPRRFAGEPRVTVVQLAPEFDILECAIA